MKYAEKQNHLVKDFARRTQTNLKVIESLKNQNVNDVYEVTQMVNSMLGLLVFPMTTFYNQLPDKTIQDLENEGWPKVDILEGSTPCNNLRSLIRFLRNGIAHCNLKFMAGSDDQIIGIEIWNSCNSCNRVTWKARIPIEDLRIITDKFIEIINRVEENG